MTTPHPPIYHPNTGLAREKWSAAMLAYTQEQRSNIMACIHRLNLECGGTTLPRPHQRQLLRAWFRQRGSYLVGEYEKVRPQIGRAHV